MPMERPNRFAGRTIDSITEAELAQFGRESNDTRRKGEAQNNGFSGLSPLRLDLQPSRAWFVIDPPDGRIPPPTALANNGKPPISPSSVRQRRPRNRRTSGTAASASEYPRR